MLRLQLPSCHSGHRTMRVLRHNHRDERRMQRILVGGVSGAGKTTFARELSERLSLPFSEVDAMFHGPGWTVSPEFEQDVEAATDLPSWILDSYGYSVVQDRLWTCADTLIWLDYPRWQIMPRVILRSIRRAVTREVLWNGNVDTFRAWGEATHPVRWAWTQHGPRRARVEELVGQACYGHLSVVRLRSIRAARAWLDAVGSE